MGPRKLNNDVRKWIENSRKHNETKKRITKAKAKLLTRKSINNKNICGKKNTIRRKATASTSTSRQSQHDNATTSKHILKDNLQWPLSYQDRAKCVRLVGLFDHNYEDNVPPKSVAFYSKMEDNDDVRISVYDYSSLSSCELWGKLSFEDFNDRLKELHVELNEELDIKRKKKWAITMKQVEKCAYAKRYKQDNWLARSPPRHNEIKGLHYVMHNALQFGMGNGETKNMIQYIFEYLLSVVNPSGNLFSYGAAPTKMVGEVQLLHSKHFGVCGWDVVDGNDNDDDDDDDDDTSKKKSRPSIRSRSTSNNSFCNLYNVKIKKEIPDQMIWFLGLPLFPLLVECKRAEDHNAHAMFKLFKQLLTVLHFQRNAFGIILSGNAWIIMIVCKRDSEILCYHHQCDLFTKIEDELEYKYQFNCESFTEMVNMMYRVLDGAKNPRFLSDLVG